MARPSNVIIIILNLLTLAAGLLAIGFSLWLINNNGSTCQKGLQKPVLYVGIALSVVSLLGLLGSCCKNTFILWIYLFLLFLLILGLICFTIFTIIVTNKGVGRALSNRGIDHFRLGDYSKWLQRYVVNGKNWDEIKSCMVDAHFCQRKPVFLAQATTTAIQSGCCKPPKYCGFEFHNETYWAIPKSGPAVPDNDCKIWSNVQTQLCFECQSCQTSFHDNIKREWRTMAIVNVVILIFVIIVYSTGCCALRSNRRVRYHKYRP